MIIQSLMNPILREAVEEPIEAVKEGVNEVREVATIIAR